MWTFAPSVPSPASSAGTTIDPTISNGHRTVITTNHLLFTRSRNSRLAMTHISRITNLPLPLPLPPQLPCSCASGRPFLFLGQARCDRRVADLLDEDVVQRRHDDLE